jgi:hypothetical protein
VISRLTSRRGYYNKVQAALLQNDAKNLDRETIQNAEDYVSLHAQLLEELPPFLEGMEKLLEILLGAFSLAQKDYFNGMQAHIKRFFYTVKLSVWGDESDADSTKRAHPESGSGSVPDGTTIMQIWYNAWTPEHERIQTLGLVSSTSLRWLLLLDVCSFFTSCDRYWTTLRQFESAWRWVHFQILASSASITDWRIGSAVEPGRVAGASQSQFIIHQCDITKQQGTILILIGASQL